MNRIIVNKFGGGVLLSTERRQALGLSPRLPKGGLRHRLTIGGDLYE